MDLKKFSAKKNIWFSFAIIGGIQFIILTIIAMIVYPGGYDFWNNYFSQLGTFTSYVNGQSSMASYILWVIACTSAAILLIPFWLTLKMYFTRTKVQSIISRLGSYLGIASAPFLSLIAVFTTEYRCMSSNSSSYELFFLYFTLHKIAMYLFFILFALALIMYSIEFIISKEYNKFLAVYGMFTTIIIILEIVFVGPLGAAFQKITVYLMISFVVIIAIYFLNHPQIK